MKHNRLDAKFENVCGTIIRMERPRLEKFEPFNIATKRQIRNSFSSKLKAKNLLLKQKPFKCIIESENLSKWPNCGALKVMIRREEFTLPDNQKLLSCQLHSTTITSCCLVHPTIICSYVAKKRLVELSSSLTGTKHANKRIFTRT